PAADARIKALGVLTAWGDWPTFLATSTFVPPEDRLKVNNPEFLAKMAPLEPLAWLPKVQARSLRIQDVRKDGHMPDAAQERMEKAAPDKAEIDQFGDAAALVPAAASGRLLGWIKGQLQPEPRSEAPAEKRERIHFYPARMPASRIVEPH